MRTLRSLLVLALALTAHVNLAQAAPQRSKIPEWLSSEFPLPLAVRGPQDLAFKAQAERQFLIFNLFVSGKVAWDAGDYATAAAKWESLIGVPGLDPEVDKLLRPFLLEARSKAGQPSAALPPAPVVQAKPDAPAPEKPKKAALVMVEGTVTGGGRAGPGGAVITLKRLDGPVPKLAPVRDRLMLQKDKAFLPRVVAVPVGSSVLFRNEDGINHNVFSLTQPTPFDAGYVGTGKEAQQQFDKPGAFQLLCSIHVQMQGWVVVVDTPLYGQADEAGSFKIAGVPPGEYEAEAWHEFASKTVKQKLTVGREGAKLQLAVGGDRVPSAFVPDKYGKPRQAQIGY